MNQLERNVYKIASLESELKKISKELQALQSWLRSEASGIWEEYQNSIEPLDIDKMGEDIREEKRNKIPIKPKGYRGPGEHKYPGD